MAAQAAASQAHRTAGRASFQFMAGQIRKFNRATEECLPNAIYSIARRRGVSPA
jgi:hypothetical protein